MSEEAPTYEIVKCQEKHPHGNTKRGLPFHDLVDVGDSFTVPPSDYSRTSSARAHFQKKTKKRVSSRAVKDADGNIVAYVFRLEKK